MNVLLLVTYIYFIFYNLQAIDYYLKALRSLGKREMHPAVWDSVNWELSTTYFTMATLQQDYAPLSRKAQEQVMEREDLWHPLT